MARQRVYRQTPRTPEEAARDREIRERIQNSKPTIEQMEGQGSVFLPLGDVLAMHAIGFRLRAEREKQGLPQSEVSRRAGMDVPALSRIETGKNPNPTLETLGRIAKALGKNLGFVLHDEQDVRQLASLLHVPVAVLSDEGLEEVVEIDSGLTPVASGFRMGIQSVRVGRPFIKNRPTEQLVG